MGRESWVVCRGLWFVGRRSSMYTTLTLTLRAIANLDQALGGAVAAWLVCPTPERVVQVRVLAGDIVLCS